jgi:hypothetical protein
MSLEKDTTEIKNLVEAGLFKPATPEQIASRPQPEEPYEPQDFTGKFGQLGSQEEWEMYSFERVSSVFWNGFANELGKRGYNLNQIKTILQSKLMRQLLDGDDSKIEDLGAAMGGLCAARERRGIEELMRNEL